MFTVYLITLYVFHLIAFSLNPVSLRFAAKELLVKAKVARTAFLKLRWHGDMYVTSHCIRKAQYITKRLGEFTC